MSAATFHGIWRSTCLTCYRKDVQDTNVMAPKDMARAEANQRSNVLQAGLLDEVLPRVSFYTLSFLLARSDIVIAKKLISTEERSLATVNRISPARPITIPNRKTGTRICPRVPTSGLLVRPVKYQIVKDSRRFHGKESSPLEAIRELAIGFHKRLKLVFGKDNLKMRQNERQKPFLS